jgi:DeoR/GlpR family transcriptional regulator of sugar metabolism
MFTSFAPLRAAHTIVTDRSAPADVLDSIRLQGVEVLVAD